MTESTLRDQVRERYAEAARAVTGRAAERASRPTAESAAESPTQSATSAASCCGAGECCGDAAAFEGDAASFGAARYSDGELAELPADAVLASLGCGNPLAVAALQPGDRVLDLGSGGGIDVLLSAKRVGPTGKAFGLDMTDEMLALARANAAKAGAGNVEFLKGEIEAIPLPADSIDAVISNCVINLSTDKPAVLAEMFRVLTPGGRIGITDVVAEDDLTPQQRAERGSYTGCIAGALSRSEYLAGLTAAGFTEATVDFTHEVAPGLHGAIIRAVKPAGGPTAEAADKVAGEPDAGPVGKPASEPDGAPCCSAQDQASCCEPSAKAACCGQGGTSSCGCQ